MDIHLYIAINHFQKERKAGSLWTIFIVFWGYFDNFLKSDVPVSLTFPSWHSFAKTSSLKTNPAAAAKSLQLCPTLCDPIDGSPPGSAVPGILQARTLEWAATAFSGTSPSHPQISFPFWLSSIC